MIALKTTLVVCLISGAFAGTAYAGPLEDAASAHERGDDATAVQLLRPLAEKGNAHPQFTLGFIFDTSRNILQDDAEAAKWYRMAAEQGLAGAQYNLGAMYADGHGVPRDYVEAYKWLSVAASGIGAENRESAIKMLDLVKAKMTPQQIAEARPRVEAQVTLTSLCVYLKPAGYPEWQQAANTVEKLLEID